MCNQINADDSARRKQMTRRGFLGVAGAAACGVGAIVAGCVRKQAAAPPPGASQSERKETGAASPPAKRILGRTGIEVSVLSMGGIAVNADVLRAGLDKGINLIHCAMGYGTLDQVAEAVAGRRDQVFLGLKYERAGRADWDYLGRALEMLKVDHVDIMFFPLNTPDAARDRTHLEFFEQVKRRKRARFIGITTHANVAPALQAAVQAGFWDVLMPSYVPAQKARAALRPVLDAAQKKSLGVVAMKTMTGIRPAAVAQMQTVVREVLADVSVTTLCKGMPTFERIDALLSAPGGPPSKADSASLQRHLVSRQGDVCVLCGECPPCPRGVNVFEVMRVFDYYYVQAGYGEFARGMYRSMPPGQRGAACDDCGECAAKCAYDIDIARRVRAADLILG